MLIAHSTFSCALAYKGNRVRETLRLQRHFCSEGGWSPLDGEDVSLSESELDSASLHYPMAVKGPDFVKPAINGEEMSVCSRWAIRGDWRKRASKDYLRSPGGPFRRWFERYSIYQRSMGNHNHCICRQRESERSIVAVKWGNSHGAKGPYFSHVFIKVRRIA